MTERRLSDDSPKSPLYHRDRYQALEGRARTVVAEFLAHDYTRCSAELGAAMVRLMEVLDG